jgi:hypothetical protein
MGTFIGPRRQLGLSADRRSRADERDHQTVLFLVRSECVPAVRLPAVNYYVAVDRPLLRSAMTRIEEQFRDLLKKGVQSAGIPDGHYAAGQYLEPYTINQRGLYGTSAALLALARSLPSPDRIGLVEGIIRYIIDRADIERSLVTSDSDLSELTARLAIEWDTAFKCAEILYALSAAPAAVSGREGLLERILSRISAGRRGGGGWAVDLDPAREADPLATASIVRALNAAGVPVDENDIALVRKNARDGQGTSTYVRVFCLLVCGGRDAELDTLWNELLAELSPQLRRLTEANYEYTLRNHYRYVRLPWQLYLLSCAALRSPLSIVLNQPIRRVLLDSLAAVSSPEGYIYPQSGHMRSTRTYGILMDTLWRLDQALAAARYTAPIFAVANWSARVVYSRAVTALLLAGALLLGALSLWSWIFSPNAPLSAVGPELFSAGLLAVFALLLRRLRRR